MNKIILIYGLSLKKLYFYKYITKHKVFQIIFDSRDFSNNSIYRFN
ncbi:hypothetical protein M6B38_342985 [Iris pallida]|uniref:Uncharacterized protein n=1 Tax=Iris pallida TaxID=29817 RepID=A0AAX6GVS2_IRIPA|nr:hypothetical protein M6B38_342985 [Iris pallida]